MQTARILVFGDSLVYGAWDSQGGWCDRLKQRFHREKNGAAASRKMQLFNLGIGGEDSEALLRRFTTEISTRAKAEWPLVILIATGANDTRMQQAGSPRISSEKYRKNLENLIAQAQVVTQSILLVGIAPVQNDTQSFKGTILSNAVLKHYDAIMSAVAAQTGVPKVQLFEALSTSQEQIFSSDGVHPNDVGHALIEQLVAVELEKLLAA